ncbi:Probable protease SohB [Buchnera aphidicola (Neophyllaphis podocarpi)]|uniref:protease SohB n=1 Tax=Buchnera aphidicola TaxID=9 RepID=UPI003464CDE9
MQLITNYLLFLIKFTTIILFIIFIIFIITYFKDRMSKNTGKLIISSLNDHYKEMKDTINLNRTKEKINKETEQQKIQNNNYKFKIFKNFFRKTKIYSNIYKPNLYVLDFKGSINANEVDYLKEEISAIISTAKKEDQVLLRLESSGGVIHGYGLAAMQLHRLRQEGIKLIVSVDKIAASGGYMMACVGNHIMASPFAILGSIGVVAQIPNFNKLLKKYNIDIELHTSGNYKRNLTLLGNNTEKDRIRFKKELNIAHNVFKSFISRMRPCVKINKVSNGKHWFGSIAIKKKLIDSLGTSDEFLLNKNRDFNLICIKYLNNKNSFINIKNKILNTIKKILIILLHN